MDMDMDMDMDLCATPPFSQPETPRSARSDRASIGSVQVMA